MLGDDFLDVLRLHLHVERALGEDLHDRALFAETKAARDDHLDLLGKTVRFKLFLEFFDDRFAAAGAARRAAANEYV